MEIKLENVSYNNKKVNITFPSNSITTIIEDFDNINITNLLLGNIKYTGNIIMGGKRIRSKKQNFNDKMSISSNNQNFGLFNINILEDLKYNNDEFDELELKNYLKKYNLEDDILSKNYTEISTGEKKKIALIYTLLSNKNILLFENPTSYLDNKSRETLIKELKRIKREGKIIIIITNDTEFALKVSDKVAILVNGTTIVYDDKYECFNSNEAMCKCKIKIPEIIDFVNMVYKLKKEKLHYRDDINDTIKDVYRNVK